MMNIPRQAPPMIPKKLYLLPMMERPKGNEKRALTAKTCDRTYRVSLVRLTRRDGDGERTLKHCMMKMER